MSRKLVSVVSYSSVTKAAHHLVPVTPDDADLVAQAAAGNDRAFATLYKRHARYVAGVVYRLMGSDSELDDVMQETFLDAAQALATLNDPQGLRAWLARIAVHRVYKRMARRRRWRWLLGATKELAPTVSDPTVLERVDALYGALDRIPIKLRIPWVLHTLEGEGLTETATMCDVSLATAKRRIAEADTRIQRWLHET